MGHFSGSDMGVQITFMFQMCFVQCILNIFLSFKTAFLYLRPASNLESGSQSSLIKPEMKN